MSPYIIRYEIYILLIFNFERFTKNQIDSIIVYYYLLLCTIIIMVLVFIMIY